MEGVAFKLCVLQIGALLATWWLSKILTRFFKLAVSILSPLRLLNPFPRCTILAIIVHNQKNRTNPNQVSKLCKPTQQVASPPPWTPREWSVGRFGVNPLPIICNPIPSEWSIAWPSNMVRAITVHLLYSGISVHYIDGSVMDRQLETVGACPLLREEICYISIPIDHRHSDTLTLTQERKTFFFLNIQEHKTRKITVLRETEDSAVYSSLL